MKKELSTDWSALVPESLEDEEPREPTPEEPKSKKSQKNFNMKKMMANATRKRGSSWVQEVDVDKDYENLEDLTGYSTQLDDAEKERLRKSEESINALPKASLVLKRGPLAFTFLHAPVTPLSNNQTINQSNNQTTKQPKQSNRKWKSQSLRWRVWSASLGNSSKNRWATRTTVTFS